MATTCVSFVQSDCLGTSPTRASTFDVDSAIADLMSDPAKVSLELPCLLNAAQRKHAKKVAEQHPDLKCESFGFGKDRQMHLFKKKPDGDAILGASVGQVSRQHVSVKNTFIDDWIVADDDSLKSTTRVVQSMPHNMFGQCLSEELSANTLLSQDDKDLKEVDSMPKLHESSEETQSIMPGSEVVIEGLVRAPSFNGVRGIVQSWDAATGRYNILLATTDGQQLAKIKEENLRKARPR